MRTENYVKRLYKEIIKQVLKLFQRHDPFTLFC
jgi:hypothetical protein